MKENTIEDQKLRQIDYHEREHYCAREPRRVDNSNPLIAWVNNYRLRKTLEIIGTSLAGKNVLIVCGGDGEEAEFFQEQGASVTVTDLSNIALVATKVRCPMVQCLRMDAELLAFTDGSFDWCVVRDGLHHLARPLKGLYELERVSRDGFAILEGQDSLIVRLLERLGLAESWDPAGGYVYRFSRREIHKVFSSVQTLARLCVYTAWLPFGSDVLRYFPSVRFLYPLINHPATLRLLNSRIGRRSLRSVFLGFNHLLGRWGNSLIAVAWKK
jgi:ubiquinone/menaquinone biosynthesis C-methylase UbiE